MAAAEQSMVPAFMACGACLCRYRTAFDLLKDLRSGLEPAIDSLAAAKEALLVGYDTWISSGGKQLDNSQQVL